MFGINLGEFSVIAIIAIIVVGPERLPRYAQQLGKAVREGRKMAMGLRDQVREELGPEFEEVDWRKLDPRQYDPRRIIREALTEAWDDDTAESATTGSPTEPAHRTADAESGQAAESGAASSAAAQTRTGPTPYDLEAT